MDSEYSLKISLTKHLHDNPTAPYYWCISKYDSFWHTIQLDWGETPEQCFLSAMDYFQNKIDTK